MPKAQGKYFFSSHLRKKYYNNNSRRGQSVSKDERKHKNLFVGDTHSKRQQASPSLSGRSDTVRETKLDVVMWSTSLPLIIEFPRTFPSVALLNDLPLWYHTTHLWNWAGGGGPRSELRQRHATWREEKDRRWQRQVRVQGKKKRRLEIQPCTDTAVHWWVDVAMGPGMGKLVLWTHQLRSVVIFLFNPLERSVCQWCWQASAGLEGGRRRISFAGSYHWGLSPVEAACSFTFCYLTFFFKGAMLCKIYFWVVFSQ